MAYQWRTELETGNTMIDTQHKQLIQAINDLLAACSGGKGRAFVNETVAFLASYTDKHFGDEEKLQLATKYADYKNHKKLHDNFKLVVAELRRKLEADGPTVALVAEVNSKIGDWLVTHIVKEDRKVAAHVREHS
jgi:hemerythrin